MEFSTNALREKFCEILAIENIQSSEVESAIATFDFLRGKWPTSCYIEVVTVEGKKVEVAVEVVPANVVEGVGKASGAWSEVVKENL